MITEQLGNNNDNEFNKENFKDNNNNHDDVSEGNNDIT